MDLLTLSLLGPLAVLITYFDFRERRIPNLLVLILLGAGIFLVLFQGASPWRSLGGMLGLGGGAFLLRWIYQAFQGKEGLGMGDIKLLAALGWWLDLGEIPSFLIFTGLAGALIGGLWFLVTKEKEFPFAPAIFLGYLTLHLL